MPLDLQWFAKDGEGGEKTEEPTAKKLTDARNDGKVAKSRELDNAVGLLLLFVLLQVTMSSLGNGLIGSFETFYKRIPEYVKENGRGMTGRAVSQILQPAILDMLLMVLPFFAVGFLAMVVINILQVKWKVTTKPLKPDFKKFNPINGFKRIFSKDSLVELLKSIAKIGLIMWVAYSSIMEHQRNLLLLYSMSLMQAIMLVGSVVIDTGMKISMAYFVIAIVDFIYQKWKFKDEMKMTKQEVKDEYKNAEGDPQIKGKQRQRMREASQRRMMQDVPKADVVITNPTHYAVALKYDAEEAQAPIVLAKGTDYLALQIKEKAKEAKVEIVENKPLARMLYANVEIGEEIPPELYQTVAEILAAVYRMKNKL
ncbi:MAG: flagellar biosynthesis protein FlhB [Eubacterium sp.]|nr:flagellar biosynthesis protein FlhB [Eubacterium sp.]